VNRWQALVEIVKSFNERGATSLAFAALCVIIVVPLVIGLLLAINFEWASLQVPWFRSG
jgi:uncharacterized membrane protein